MTVAKKKSASKKRYEVLIPLMQVYSFEVDAKSPEEACKTLWRRLRLNNDQAPPSEAKFFCSAWGDPQDKESQWLVGGGELVHDPNGNTGYAWDGKEISRKNLI